MAITKKRVSVHDKLTLITLFDVTVIRYRLQAVLPQVSEWEAQG
jgi:hypothetical protein